MSSLLYGSPFCNHGAWPGTGLRATKLGDWGRDDSGETALMVGDVISTTGDFGAEGGALGFIGLRATTLERSLSMFGSELQRGRFATGPMPVRSFGPPPYGPGDMDRGC